MLSSALFFALFLAISFDGGFCLLNRGVVFVKPHAATPSTIALAEELLEQASVRVIAKQSLSGKDIREQGIIDEHYMALARNALGGINPKAKTVDPQMIAQASAEARESFEKIFGVPLAQVEQEERILRSDVALEELKMTAEELETCWRDGPSVKLGSGCYISDIKQGSDSDFFAVNGFYPKMQQKFTSDEASVTVLVVEFDRRDCSWKRFRTEVIGSTDPEKATPESIRGEIFCNWQKLGLSKEPNMGDNGVHASAGPLEAIRELKLWAGDVLEQSDSPLESEILKLSNVDEATLKSWLNDGDMELNGAHDSAFDLTEEMDTDELLEALSQ